MDAYTAFEISQHPTVPFALQRIEDEELFKVLINIMENALDGFISLALPGLSPRIKEILRGMHYELRPAQEDPDGRWILIVWSNLRSTNTTRNRNDGSCPKLG